MRLPIEQTALAMVFRLVQGAQASWRCPDGHSPLPKMILGVTFDDGLEVVPKSIRQPKSAAAPPARRSPRFGESPTSRPSLEFIMLIAFAGFSVVYLKEPRRFNHRAGFVRIAAGAGLISNGRA